MLPLGVPLLQIVDDIFIILRYSRENKEREKENNNYSTRATNVELPVSTKLSSSNGSYPYRLPRLYPYRTPLNISILILQSLLRVTDLSLSAVQ